MKTYANKRSAESAEEYFIVALSGVEMSMLIKALSRMVNPSLTYTQPSPHDRSVGTYMANKAQLALYQGDLTLARVVPKGTL
jgi:hypothetical protein